MPEVQHWLISSRCSVSQAGTRDEDSGSQPLAIPGFGYGPSMHFRAITAGVEAESALEGRS